APAAAKQNPESETPSSPKQFPGVGAELWVVAQGFRDKMDKVAGYFEQVAERFDGLSGTFNAARQAIKDGRLGAELSAFIELFDGYVQELREVTPKVLALAMRAIAAMFVGLPSEVL